MAFNSKSTAYFGALDWLNKINSHYEPKSAAAKQINLAKKAIFKAGIENNEENPKKITYYLNRISALSEEDKKDRDQLSKDVEMTAGKEQSWKISDKELNRITEQIDKCLSETKGSLKQQKTTTDSYLLISRLAFQTQNQHRYETLTKIVSDIKSSQQRLKKNESPSKSRLNFWGPKKSSLAVCIDNIEKILNEAKEKHDKREKHSPRRMKP